jgi:UDP-N-acetylmuramoyl-L-alanyl-D-glutamate--2,6-diaminopimelate ligase
MKLRELLSGCGDTFREGEWLHDGQAEEDVRDMEISGVVYDSRKVKEGYMFVAIKGERVDGHNFIHDAIRNGARAIVLEREIRTTELEIARRNLSPGMEHSMEQSEIQSCFLHAKNSRRSLACIASNLYKRPSEWMTLIGITGTNGKTTTTYILKSILETWGKDVGLVGTIQYMIGDVAYPAPHTTPESPEFQALLKDMYSSGCTHVISEVSSHALAQYRVDNTRFRAAVFTNLTRDHLDFHRTMEDYFRAKERLFLQLLDREGAAIINSDDTYGKRLHFELLSKNPELRDIDLSFLGIRFNLIYRNEKHEILSGLVGLHNVYNIMSAVGVALSQGIPWSAITEGIAKTANVKGRFETVDVGQGFLAAIDYAHTEDALSRLLETAREVLAGKRRNGKEISPRIITVFGCGGDRDRGKRPRMGAVATKLSNFVIITSDNPRSEEPHDIIREIEQGAVRKNYVIEPDRGEAISQAVKAAHKGDIVLIAGKGHENYQEIKGSMYRFSDREVLEAAIKERLGNEK